MKGRTMLTLQFVPYAEIMRLPEKERIDRLLGLAKENKIVLLEGKLRAEEEAELIKRTMEQITSSFKGVEISHVSLQQKEDVVFFRKVRSLLVNLLLGERQGFTIIGPASVVKEIKRDPDKIQLLTEDIKRKK
jgi:hypothetical protein